MECLINAKQFSTFHFERGRKSLIFGYCKKNRIHFPRYYFWRGILKEESLFLISSMAEVTERLVTEIVLTIANRHHDTIALTSSNNRHDKKRKSKKYRIFKRCP